MILVDPHFRSSLHFAKMVMFEDVCLDGNGGKCA